MRESTKLLDLIERRIDEKGLPPAEISRLAVGNPYLIYNFRKKGFDPKYKTLKSLCDALDLEFYIGPPRGTAPAESPAPPPAWDTFAEATLPHRGMAKCGVQGWAKAQPDRNPLPRPENVMDDQAFYISATGQSMIPEGIDGGYTCLISPGMAVREGDRIWILDHQGRATIKRLVGRDENGDLKLRGWLPKRHGQQKSFDEERMAAGVREVYPVIAVFRGQPGSERCEYVPDPKPPEHAKSPESAGIVSSTAVPGAITDMLGLPEGAEADVVAAAIREKLAGRGTAHATSAAALDRRSMGQMLKSETRSLKDEMAAMREDITSRLPPPDAPPVAGDDPGAAPENIAEPNTDQRLSIARDVRAAAGTGEMVFEETETSINIPRDTLPPGLGPERAIALCVEGGSMEPTIRSGDILVIDHGDREPLAGRIYVLGTQTGLVVKRLMREGYDWIMTSDNGADWPPRPVGEADRVLGRVVWFGPEKALVVGG